MRPPILLMTQSLLFVMTLLLSGCGDDEAVTSSAKIRQQCENRYGKSNTTDVQSCERTANLHRQ